MSAAKLLLRLDLALFVTTASALTGYYHYQQRRPVRRASTRLHVSFRVNDDDKRLVNHIPTTTRMLFFLWFVRLLLLGLFLYWRIQHAVGLVFMDGPFSAKQLANLTPTSPVMASYGSECAVLIGRLKCQPRAIPEPTPAGQSLPLGV